MKIHSTRLLATAAVAALTLTGCGGGPDGADAPKDASVAAFCEVVEGMDASDPEGFAEDLAEIGTPKGIPADARAGFEAMVANATEEKISDGEQDKISTFLAYFTSTCAG